MKHTRIFLLIALLAFPLYAQQPTPPEPATPATASEPGSGTSFTQGQIDFGGVFADSDDRSSKFDEYRDLSDGFIVSYFRITGGGEWDFNISGQNVDREDARYHASAGRGSFGVTIDFNGIPHRLGEDGRSVLNRTSNQWQEVSDTIQQSIQSSIESVPRTALTLPFLRSLVAPAIHTGDIVDLGYKRQRSSIEVAFGGSPDVRVQYQYENRQGNRPSGTSFGFNNVVESAEPIEYRTREIAALAEMPIGNGLVRGMVSVNDFENRIDFYHFDNPFRFTDATDPNAYFAPANQSIAGARFGRMALTPDSESLTGQIGLIYRLPMNSRFTADVSLSNWTQDQQFIPYTTNTAIVTTDGRPATALSTLPQQSLDGEINVLRQNYTFTIRPVTNLTLRANLRRYDLDNDTARIEFPGYVRFDGAWVNVPRISVPYGFTNDRADLIASFDIGPATLEAGYRYDRWDREYRDTEETTEDIFRLAADVRPASWVALRAAYEKGERDYDHYDTGHSEHASYLLPGATTNLPELRRFDQAGRDLDRINASVELMPFDSMSFSVGYSNQKEDYDTDYGLVDAKYSVLSAELNYAPTSRLNLFVFGDLEDISTFQRGRQSGAVPSTDFRDDWTADISNDATSWGIGGSYMLIADRLELKAFAPQHKFDGHNDMESPEGGVNLPRAAEDIAAFDDFDILTIAAELQYRLGRRWAVALGMWNEKYEEDDAAMEGLNYYMPGGFFLAPDQAPSNYADVSGSTAYLRASFRF